MFISPLNLGQEFMSLPMTRAEYDRMKQLESGGMTHEAAKAQIYAERGPSGEPRSSIPATAQAAPQKDLPVATAVPVGFFGKVGIWMDGAPWWKVSLAGGAALGTLVFVFSRVVKVGRTPDGKLTSRFGGSDPVFEDLYSMDDAPTGVFASNPGCCPNPGCSPRCRCKKPCRCR